MHLIILPKWRCQQSAKLYQKWEQWAIWKWKSKESKNVRHRSNQNYCNDWFSQNAYYGQIDQYNQNNQFNDIWNCNGQSWVNHDPSQSPSNSLHKGLNQAPFSSKCIHSGELDPIQHSFYTKIPVRDHRIFHSLVKLTKGKTQKFSFFTQFQVCDSLILQADWKLL